MDTLPASGLGPLTSQMRLKTTEITMLSGINPLVSFNVNRYYLGFGIADVTASVQVEPGNAMTSIGGFIIGSGSGLWFLEFFFSRHGIIAQSDWQYSTFSSGKILTVVEGIWFPT